MFDNGNSFGGTVTMPISSPTPAYQPPKEAAPGTPWWQELMANRPAYSGYTDANGKLLPQYQFDPSQYALNGANYKLDGSKYNLDTSQYSKDLQDRLAGIQLDQRGLEAYRNEALRTGPSAWQKLMLKNQALEEQNARDQASQQGMSQNALARSALAARGGLSGGSAERLAKQGARDLLSANQDVGRQGMLARTGIATQDEANRIQQLSQLPGMEVQALQPELQKTGMWQTGQQDALKAKQYSLDKLASADQYNMEKMAQADQFNAQQKAAAQQYSVQQALADLKAKNDYELQKWQEESKARSAERQAQATEKSAKKGFLGLG